MAESYINYIKLPDGNVAKFSLPNTLKIGNQTYDGTSNVSATTATQSANGLMSAEDKKKLDGIATGATKVLVDTALSNTSTNTVQNKVIKTALDNKFDKAGGTLTGNLTGKYLTGTWLQTTESTDLGRTPGKVAVLDDSGWVYYRTPAEIKSDIGADAVATTSANGLMSAADKTKLNGIATGATKITVDTALSNTSTNPVQNKVVNDALKGKFSTSGGVISGDVTMSKFLYLNGPLYASATILAETDVQCLYNNDLRIRLACDSSGVAEITTDGAESYARLKIASPTDNNDAATKNYVDSKWDDMRQIVNTEVQSVITGLLDKTYPVGSIYMSVNETSPGTLFGGTWEQIAGKFLVGIGNSFAAGESGGAKAHSHTTEKHALTIHEMPKHNHDGLYYSYIDTENLVTLNGGTVSYHIPWGSSSYAGDYGAGSGEKELITGTTGGGAEHGHGNTGITSNLPPYLAVYIWKRTA